MAQGQAKCQAFAAASSLCPPFPWAGIRRGWFGARRGRCQCAQHTPIRACQLTFPRYTCPHTNHLPYLRMLPAVDARKDVEQHREPVLHLSSQIPKVPLALFLFALVFLSLVLNLSLGLDDVPQSAQNRWTECGVGIYFLREPLA